jgi:mono/diheme cytochrome c family protein
MNKRILGGAIVFGALAIAIWATLIRDPSHAAMGSGGGEDALVAVTMPVAFAPQEQMGAKSFEENCAACHGANAAGREGMGPPLVHIIYEPSHHGDQSFHLAVMNGVRAHHWPFGNMPPVKGLARSDVETIVAYVRALQRANGIN